MFLHPSVLQQTDVKALSFSQREMETDLYPQMHRCSTQWDESCLLSFVHLSIACQDFSRDFVLLTTNPGVQVNIPGSPHLAFMHRGSFAMSMPDLDVMGSLHEVMEFSTCLTATSSPLSLFRPRYTLPNAPAPISSPQDQFLGACGRRASSATRSRCSSSSAPNAFCSSSLQGFFALVEGRPFCYWDSLCYESTTEFGDSNVLMCPPVPLPLCLLALGNKQKWNCTDAANTHLSLRCMAVQNPCLLRLAASRVAGIVAVSVAGTQVPAQLTPIHALLPYPHH